MHLPVSRLARIVTTCVGIGLALLPMPSVAKAPAPKFLIIQGHKVKIETVPWQVAIVKPAHDGTGRALHCGGVIIAQQWVLTAAHCVDAVEDSRVPGQQPPVRQVIAPNSIHVIAGTTTLAGGGQDVEIAAILVHDDWKTTATPMDNDAALLRLKAPLPGSATVRAISLFRNTVGPELGDALVSGWGRTEADRTSPVLLATKVPIVPSGACSNAYPGLVSIAMVCAGKPGGGPDSCLGDSGGPLAMGRKGEEILVGLVSWGMGCGESGHYGVYTRINQIGPWIARTAGPNAVKWTSQVPGPLFVSFFPALDAAITKGTGQ